MTGRFAAVAALVITGSALVSGCTIGGSSGKPVTVTVTAPSGATAAATTPDSAPPPAPSDFAVDVTVTEQRCYGTAGCSYELNINPRFVGLSAPTGKWKVIYEITGGDDPQTGNFTVDGSHIRWDSDKTADGSSGAVFSARVTQVLPEY